MATIQKEVVTRASPDQTWDAIRDIGALHTRLVPGFVIDTKVVPGARIVTFVDGATARERIVSLDEKSRRLVWTAEAPFLEHHNGSVQVIERGTTTCVIWTADFLPDEAFDTVNALIEAGGEAMRNALDRLSTE